MRPIFPVLFLLSLSLLTNCSRQVAATALAYPGGKSKALILSYDDGVIEDIPFAHLLEDHGLVGTFNLNSGYLGVTRGWPQPGGDTVFQQYIPVDSVRSVYKNHEIAAHGTFHQDFLALTEAEIREEIGSDIANLERLAGHRIESMAYPVGRSDAAVATIVGTTGLTNARTVADTHTFALPDSLFLWHPTCHDSRAPELTDAYLALPNDTLSLFYVWGHAWEFKDPARWLAIQDFCRKMGHQTTIWSVGSGAYVTYLAALHKVRRTPNRLHNPASNPPVWVRLANGQYERLAPGASRRARMGSDSQRMLKNE